MAELIGKGKAVMDTVQEEIPVIREALSEIGTQPKNAFAKIVEVCKDVWAKIIEVGLIGAIMEQIKNMIGAATAAASSSTSRTAPSIPDVPTGDPQNLTIAGQPAPDTPLLSKV